MVRDFMLVWRALEERYEERAFRAVGVSNFHQHHLERLLNESEIVPAVNQIESHPYLTQEPLRAFNSGLGIVTEAWSPIAQGLVLSDPVVVEMARRLGRTPAQVVLRWHLQQETVVFPKSVSPSRMAENLDVMDFVLNSAEMAALSGLNRNERTGADPDTFRYKW
jgi:2,5-diketo-D-gluconate reductase A